jgi:hypothetical protein
MPPGTRALVEDQLQQANGIVQATAQGSLLIGPALAGLIIAVMGGDESAPSTAGIGLALLVDAATFVVSLVTLLLIRPRPHAERPASSMLDDIRAGFRYVLGMAGLRAMIVMSLAANFLIVGPFEVGLPVIAYQRLPEGAAAFGILMSAFGGGSLLGLVLAAMLPKPRPRLPTIGSIQTPWMKVWIGVSRGGAGPASGSSGFSSQSGGGGAGTFGLNCARCCSTIIGASALRRSTSLSTWKPAGLRSTSVTVPGARLPAACTKMSGRWSRERQPMSPPLRPSGASE